jgi:lambda family phage portal protein
MGIIKRAQAALRVLTGNPKQRRGYDAANRNNLTFSWSTSPIAVNDEIFRSLTALRTRSRELANNNDYAKKYLTLQKTNVIGPQGIQLQVQAVGGVSDRRASAIEQAWDDWGKAPDVTGKLSWLDVQNLIIESVARDGEALVRLVKGYNNPYRFAVQVLDADLLDVNYHATNGDNRVVMGVEVDDWGKPMAYWLYKDHPQATIGVKNRERVRVPASEIIHIYSVWRPGQMRGIPWMHAGMTRLNMLGGYEEAELVAARCGASKMGFFTRNDQFEGYDGDTREADGQLIDESTPGAWINLPNGVTPHEYDPNHPNANFGTFVKGILRGVASALGISYNSLANDLEGVNFSSIRAGLLEDRDGFMGTQQWFIDHVCQPIYAAWLDMGTLTGVVDPSRVPALLKASVWQGRRWGWVDPLKDMQANLLAVRMGVTSIDDVIRGTGRDPDAVVGNIAKSRDRYTSNGLTPILTFIDGNQKGKPSK